MGWSTSGCKKVDKLRPPIENVQNISDVLQKGQQLSSANQQQAKHGAKWRAILSLRLLPGKSGRRNSNAVHFLWTLSIGIPYEMNTGQEEFSFEINDVSLYLSTLYNSLTKISCDMYSK